MITTCTRRGGLYEAGSEEQANEPERFCFTCRKIPQPAATPPTFGGGLFSTCGKINDGLPCTLPRGTACPDCAPARR